MTHIRIRYEKRGGHYHCRLFTSQDPSHSYAKCGHLVFDEREWVDIRDKLSRCEWLEEMAVRRETEPRKQVPLEPENEGTLFDIWWSHQQLEGDALAIEGAKYAAWNGWLARSKVLVAKEMKNEN